MREMHRVFVPVDFHGLAVAIILIRVVRETAWIDGPHIPFRFALCDPFGQHLARTAALRNPKGKYASLIGIWHARHRADQGQPIGCIRDRPIDHTTNAGSAQQRHTGHGVFNIPLQPFQIVRV